jgi:hypothetical protein
MVNEHGVDPTLA